MAVYFIPMLIVELTQVEHLVIPYNLGTNPIVLDKAKKFDSQKRASLFLQCVIDAK
jgi:hypothetical protein